MTVPDASFLTVRPAAPEDLDTLLAIDAQCFPPGIAYPREEIAFLLRTRDGLTLVAERSESMLGFASLRLLRRRQPPQRALRGELITIDVRPEFRRAHMGRRLYQGLEDWLRACGGKSIELHVAVDNTPAIHFYERLGFRTIGRAPQYYLETIDAWHMEKLFT
jgi:ribosomal-protein-alanine N-acetyltransferase